MARDLKLGLEDVIALVPALLQGNNAATNGITIDRQDYERTRLEVLVGNSGDVLSGALYLELGLEHSDDGTTWADCADSDILDAVTSLTGDTGVFAVIDAPAEDSDAFGVVYVGFKRYVRVVAYQAGNHATGVIVGATALMQPKYAV